MASSVKLHGSLSVGGDACVSGCGGGGSGGKQIVPLQLSSCSAEFFEAVVQLPTPFAISTAGAVGDQFEDIAALASLSRVELLLVTSTAGIQLRIGAASPVVVGSGGTFPTGFAGGETLVLTVDVLSFTTTFDAADQTAAQVASRINAAAALAGVASAIATVDATSGELTLTGILTGSQGVLSVDGGTAVATLGLTVGSTSGAGADVAVNSLFLTKFGRGTLAPARVQVSGTANLTILAAGLAAT